MERSKVERKLKGMAKARVDVDPRSIQAGALVHGMEGRRAASQRKPSIHTRQGVVFLPKPDPCNADQWAWTKPVEREGCGVLAWLRWRAVLAVVSEYSVSK